MMDKFVSQPYLLKNKIQNYAWGTTGENAFIPKFINETARQNTPYAELWIGAHPNAPSELNIGGNAITLDKLIADYPKEILGAELAAKYDNKLSFLFKVLSAAESLSIQAHPNKLQAVQLHQRDPNHYPDENHKPEVAIALDSLTALIGFKPLSDIKKVLNDYPELVSYLDDESVSLIQKITSFSKTDERSLLKRFYTTLMRKSITHETQLVKSLVQLENRLQSQHKKLTEVERLFLELKIKYGYDVGLFSIFILNLVKLKKGEAVFLSAGVPHAYLKGNIVECMANSDNVVRAGLTPKFKDIDTLIDILTYNSQPVNIIKPNAQKTEFNYEIPVREFSITRRMYEKNHQEIKATHNRPAIILVVEGEVTISWDDNNKKQFCRGQSILLPASLESYRLSSCNYLLLYEVNVPG